MLLKYPKCVYCGSSRDVTQDHVPPKSFFPKPRPSDLITVPACRKCNGNSGKDEEWFLATFMFTEAGITDAGRRLWDEKLHRMYEKNFGLKKSIAKSFEQADLVTPGGLYLGRRLAIRHDEARSAKVIHKIVRGLYYHEYQDPLPLSIEVISHFLQQSSEVSVVEKFAPMLLFGSREWPNLFEYRYNRVTDQPQCSLWVMRFFGKLVFWAVSGNEQMA